MGKRRKLICPECKKRGITTVIEVDYRPGRSYVCPHYHLVTAPHDNNGKDEGIAEKKEETKRHYPPGTFVLSEQSDEIQKEYLEAYGKGDRKGLRRITREALQRRRKEGKNGKPKND